MTSTVVARTSAPLTAVLAATFPPASITGAPKRRTMEIIAELETSPRRIYTGAIGFLAPGRRAQFSVAIRTALLDRRRGTGEYGVGGGIVWDSDAADERVECQTKARILEADPAPFELLETLLWTPRKGYRLLGRHLRRLAESASYFDFACDGRRIRRELARLSRSLSPVPHRVRLLLARDGRRRYESAVCRPIAGRGPPRVAFARSPVDSRNVLLYHKTTHRGVYQDALAERPGCDDVILHNERGEVTESTIANVVADIGGVLYTPPLECGLLAGTARASMLSRGEIRERVITVEQLRRARRLFLVNSVRGMYEVKLQGGNGA
jgi:para-aminobenzoate synthetase/4-amino-4-deoxychorismate lyase